MTRARESVATMKDAIAARFPSEAEVVNARVIDYDHDAYEMWLEMFCDTTNAAMARRDETLVRAHLTYVSQQLAKGDGDVVRAIDVAYAENMMCGLDVKTKRWAWPLVPANLKRLYVAMWGEPRL